MNLNALFYETLHVYLDERSVKIVQIKQHSGAKQVSRAYYKDIEGLSLESIAQEIKAGLASIQTTARRVSVVLPSKYAITKNIEVPSLEKDEIENIVRLQAVRHTPYSKEEVIIGYINLEKLLERYTKVLLVIVSNEHVQKKTDVFEAAGLEIEAVHLASDVLVKLINVYRPFQNSESPCGLLRVESDLSDFIIAHNAKPYFIRSIPVGFAHIKREGSASVRQLTDELKKTCEAYQSEDKAFPVKRLLLAGPGIGSQTELLKTLKDEFAVETEVIALEDKLPLSTEAASALRSYNTADLLDVIADGLTQDPLTVDLLPQDLKVRRSFREKGKEIFTAAIFILAILGLMAGIFSTKIYFRGSYLKDITKNFEVKQKEAQDLDVISEKTRVVREFIQKKGLALKVLAEIQKLLPPDMYLSEISMTEDGHVSLKGSSSLMSGVFSFVTQLENSPVFKGVTSDYTKSRKENDKEVSDFGLSASLEESTDHGR